MDVKSLERQGFYVESSTATVLCQPTEMFCSDCGKILMKHKAGDLMFTQTHGDCTCSWACCKPGNRRHTRHLQYRAI
jgi:hypothetical protein